MPDAILLSARDLERALDFPLVLATLAAAFRAEHAGAWDTPRRITASTAAGGLLAMPCAGGSPVGLGAKLVTTFPANAAGLPTVSGLYALFDPETGRLQAVMDGGYLTLVRTAAVSALVTDLLAAPAAESLGILGAGAQAGFHARFIARVRPIKTVRIWARRPEQAESLIVSLRGSAECDRVKNFEVTSSPDEAVRADVVVTATSSPTPLLRGFALREGAHVNAIGAHTRTTREMDTEAVTRASRLLVESADTLLEAGDFQIAQDEGGGVIARVETLATLVAQKSPLPRDPQAISLFKSCGVAFEDLAVAALGAARARDLGLGHSFRFDGGGVA